MTQPPYGSKRAAAMAIYTPPFRYEHGYIFDSANHMVADNGGIGDDKSVECAVAARVRGWGRIGYMPDAAALQDEVGQMMADALNDLYKNSQNLDTSQERVQKSEKSEQVPLTDEQCDKVLQRIDEWATGYGAQEYGLPLFWMPNRARDVLREALGGTV